MRLLPPFRQRTPCQQWQGLFKPNQLTPYDLSLSTSFVDDFVAGDDLSITTDNSQPSVYCKRYCNPPGQVVGNTSDATDASTVGIAEGTVNAVGQEAGLGLSVANAPFLAYNLQGGAMTLEWRLKNVTLSTGVDRWLFLVGMADLRFAPTNAIMFTYTDSAGPNWKCVAVRGGAATTIDSGVPVVISRYQKLKIITGVDGLSASFAIDGNVVATMQNLQLPAVNQAMNPFINMRKTVGAGFGGWRCDYVSFQQNLVSAR